MIKLTQLRGPKLRIHIIKNALRKRLGPRIKMPGLGKTISNLPNISNKNQLGRFKIG